MNFKLQGKVALVTGGSRGIGAEICRTLARYGADVAVNYVDDPEGRNRREAEEVAGQVAALGVRTGVFEADVSDSARVDAMVEAVTNRLGPIDILVNNAAILRDKTMKKITPEDWQMVIAVNLTGVFVGQTQGDRRRVGRQHGIAQAPQDAAAEVQQGEIVLDQQHGFVAPGRRRDGAGIGARRGTDV